ncbi:bifunctional hydroxymethylpyrimidine kinase/phosphomethylpyrimidine kinase [soil metagenome]
MMTDISEDTDQPVCLTIAGLDPSGGAGIVADIKTFTAHGCFAAAVVSSVTFQNTTDVFGSVHQTADSVRRQADPVFDDYDIAAAKTGMLPTREIIEEAAAIFLERGTRKLVVDPVVRSTSGFDLIDDAALTALIEMLFPLALVITPNIPEAERIAGITIKSRDDITLAARKMQELGARNVLIKGGHFIDDNESPRAAIDHLFVGDEVILFENEYIDTKATHGTGCTLAAAITANLAHGLELSEAVRRAKDFVTDAIRNATRLGKGHSPLNIR